MRKTQRIPFNTTRASHHGRPRPSGRRFGASSGFSFFHCASVRSMYSIYASSHNPHALNGLYVLMR